MEKAQEIWNIKSSEFPYDGDLEHQIEFILRYAILAPSTHNSQPWLFDVEGGSCKIYSNPSVNIYYADIKGRDLHISIGCCIENLITAAKWFGIYNDVQYYCGRNDNLLAEVQFQSRSSTHKPAEIDELLFRALTKRRNHRRKYLDKDVNMKQVDELRSLNSFQDIEVDFVTDKGVIHEVGELTKKGVQTAYRNPEFRKEMSTWMHSSFSKKRDGLLGYSLGVPALLSVILPTTVRFLNIGKKIGNLCKNVIQSAPMVCILSANDDHCKTWLKVGRLAQRYLLLLDERGLQTSVYVASIEIGDHHKELQELLGLDTIPQFLFTLGYMDGDQPYSPRHSVTEKIVSIEE
ncbi:Acg family FMN-binding oxidoreductase [Patescibacteria group bacterium]